MGLSARPSEIRDAGCVRHDMQARPQASFDVILDHIEGRFDVAQVAARFVKRDANVNQVIKDEGLVSKSWRDFSGSWLRCPAPSPGSRFVRATLSHEGRGEERLPHALTVIPAKAGIQ